MSSKIEVSRTTIESAIVALTRHLDGHAPMQVPMSNNDSDMVREELRALIAAPVVERRPFGMFGMYRFDERKCSMVGDPDGDWCYGSPSELAELQATIARLTAENERLKGLRPDFPPRPPDGEGLPRYGLRWNGPQQPLAVQMDDGYWTPWHLAERLKSEIERLKGRHGEPVLWFKRLVGAECRSDGRTYDVMFCETPGYSPLFSSQPSPVSVEHSCGLDTKSKCSACLDKVKELNL